jgi:hypothetical protein
MAVNIVYHWLATLMCSILIIIWSLRAVLALTVQRQLTVDGQSRSFRVSQFSPQRPHQQVLRLEPDTRRTARASTCSLVRWLPI